MQFILSLVVIFCLLAASAVAQIAGSSDASEPTANADRGIGYPTVSAALEALKGLPNVIISVQGGWTIASDPANNTIWSFTPADHPAHPAVVKRTVVQRNGTIFVRMNALCGAEKSACDDLIVEFEKLNERMTESIRQQSAGRSSRWAPSEAQRTAAMAIATKFMRAMDSENYVAAHDLMTSGMKAMLPLNKFVSSEQEFWSMSGGEPVRSDIRVTWYKDPPRAQAPGVYAAIDVNCRYRNIEKCTEVIILHEEAGGFRVMRHERNIFESREDNLNMRDP